MGAKRAPELWSVRENTWQRTAKRCGVFFYFTGLGKSSDFVRLLKVAMFLKNRGVHRVLRIEMVELRYFETFPDQ